jgi:hypothetical protein
VLQVKVIFVFPAFGFFLSHVFLLFNSSIDFDDGRWKLFNDDKKEGKVTVEKILKN